jgi:hypothetical protein
VAGLGTKPKSSKIHVIYGAQQRTTTTNKEFPEFRVTRNLGFIVRYSDLRGSKLKSRFAMLGGLGPGLVEDKALKGQNSLKSQ